MDFDFKLKQTQEKIQDWYHHWNGQVYISFSGGKDSTVLLDIVRKIYPNVPAVFIDTGLEYPEIREFVKSIDNVVWVKPKMNFSKVIEKYGYPVISKENSQKINEIRNTKSEYLLNKRLQGDNNGNGKLPEKWKFLIEAPFKISNKCCDVLKKKPSILYETETGRKGFVGLMGEESALRSQSYKKYGCNAFGLKRPQSRPLMPWSELDIYQYIDEYNIDISEIYSMGYKRTGCMFCMFGSHLKEDNRFSLMKKTHPKQYIYCMNKLGLDKVLHFIKYGTKKRFLGRK